MSRVVVTTDYLHPGDDVHEMLASHGHHPAWSHHAAVTHHARHHRGHPVHHKASDLTGVSTDHLREVRIIRGLLNDDTRWGNGELATVAARIPEEGRQGLAHTHNFGSITQVGVHARHMRFQLCRKVRGIRPGGGPHTARYFFDRAAESPAPTPGVSRRRPSPARLGARDRGRRALPSRWASSRSRPAHSRPALDQDAPVLWAATVFAGAFLAVVFCAAVFVAGVFFG
jgi:hypothetical protein